MTPTDRIEDCFESCDLEWGRGTSDEARAELAALKQYIEKLEAALEKTVETLETWHEAFASAEYIFNEMDRIEIKTGIHAALSDISDDLTEIRVLIAKGDDDDSKTV